MDGAGNIEFDAAHRDALATGEEVIDFGRGHVPRWVVVLGVVFGVAAIIVGLVVVLSPGGPRAVVTERRPVPTPAPAPGTGLGARLPLPNEATLDVAVARSTTWVLQPDYLSLIVAGARHSVSVSGAGLSAVSAAGTLLLDTALEHLWLVVTGVSPCHLIEYDAATLQRLRQVSWPQAVLGSALLGGHLYLATASGVADLAPGESAPKLIPGSAGGAGGSSVLIAADPQRTRLLVIQPGYPGYPSLIRQYRADTGMSTAVSIPIDAADIVVADGAIWVSGNASTAQAVQRLDPTTLRPVASSPLINGGLTGPGILTSGVRVFWLSSGAPTSQIWCVDAATGRALQSWAATGNVASTLGVARVATTAGVFPLILNQCPG
ncbi:MAG: hypothetical protein M3N95_12310 [Actinomycetota bacterium]|nr:hypothetical protein [Actinomycetota bacterium]